MNSLPVRFFHAFLSGAVVSLVLALVILQFDPTAHATTTGGGGDSPSSGETSGSGTASNSTPATDPNDLDSDGIPNAWEIAHSHDPNDDTDDSRDFDNDVNGVIKWGH